MSSTLSSETDSETTMVSSGQVSLSDSQTSDPHNDSTNTLVPPTALSPRAESSLFMPEHSGMMAILPTRGTMLPWGAHKERPSHPPVAVDTDLKPGEFVMRTLFVEFTIQAERKMEIVMTEPLVIIYHIY